MKQYAKVFTVDIFHRGVLVFFGSQEQLDNYIKQKYPCYSEYVKDIDSPGDTATTLKLKDDAIIYGTHPLPEGRVVHEIVHATKHLLSLVGVEDEETECYTIEYLYDAIIPWLRSISSSEPDESQ